MSARLTVFEQQLVSRFVGVPYADKGRSPSACDCWGLIVLVMAARGITIPSYLGDYVSPDEKAEIDAVINGEKQNPLWQKVEDPEPFDIALFRVGRFESHAGLVTGRHVMLHQPGQGHSRIERFDAGQWAPRLAGFWRFKS